MTASWLEFLAPPTSAPPNMERWSAVVSIPGHGYAGCKLRGCRLPRQVNPSDGKMSDFCCSEHAKWTSKPSGWKGSCQMPGCALPTDPRYSSHADPSSGRSFGYCCATHRAMDTQRLHEKIIEELRPSDFEWQSCQRQFEVRWLHPRPRPNIKAIFKVNVSADWQSEYEDYRNTVIDQNPSVFGCGGPANEQRRFHGSMAKCSLGQNGYVAVCWLFFYL